MATVCVAGMAREVILPLHSALEIASGEYCVDICPSFPPTHKEIAELEYVQQVTIRMVKGMEHSGYFTLLKPQSSHFIKG